MTRNEIKETILKHGVIEASEIIEKSIQKKLDRHSWWWFGILTFFCVVFLGFLNQREEMRNEYISSMEERYKEYNRQVDEWKDSVDKYVNSEYPDFYKPEQVTIKLKTHGNN
jgi:hypothetical protein